MKKESKRKPSQKEFSAKIRQEFASVTLAILDWLYESMEGFAAMSLSKDAGYRILHDHSGSYLNSHAISQYFSSLKSRGYIKIEKNGAGDSIIFTDKAKIALIEKIADKQEEDAVFRYLSFDIPETMRRNRDGFRRTIKKLGFVQVQKSLWVVNKNVGDLVELAACTYEVGQYMVYIVSANSDIDGVLQKRFQNINTQKQD